MSTPAELKYIAWNKVPREKLNPLIDRETVSYTHLTLPTICSV